MYGCLIEATITVTTIAALSTGLLCVALGVIVASIAAVCLHLHGRCLLHAAILSLSIMLHMLHCYSKENSERQSYCIGVSFIICMISLYP